MKNRNRLKKFLIKKKKQTHGYRKQTYGYQKGKGVGI